MKKWSLNEFNDYLPRSLEGGGNSSSENARISSNSINKTIKISVCYHRKFSIIKNDILIPIQAGKILSKTRLDMEGDDTGDNISGKNPYYCELTVLYWLWKNSNAEIKGLFHYRRLLNLNTYEVKFKKFNKNFIKKYGLKSDRINEIMKSYDIILPFPVKLKDKSVYEYYCRTHIQSDIDRVLKIIDEKYPQMYETAEKLLKEDNNIYLCNILIAKRELFDEYAQWLFSIFFELEKEIENEVLGRDEYQKRVYGFLSETLMNIFITHKQKDGIKIAHAPMLIQEENTVKYYKYKLNWLRRDILTLFGIKKEKWEKKKCPI